MSHSEADSPVRPEVLQFQEEKTGGEGGGLSPVGRKTHAPSPRETASHDSNALIDDEVVPPPSSPPPPLEDPLEEKW
jgi:hypothetical protein